MDQYLIKVLIYNSIEIKRWSLKNLAHPQNLKIMSHILLFSLYYFQIPQIILDDAIINKRGANIHILVTQPRRIAASSLATRVAEERNESLGISVGYAVRLEK